MRSWLIVVRLGRSRWFTYHHGDDVIEKVRELRRLVKKTNPEATVTHFRMFNVDATIAEMEMDELSLYPEVLDAIADA